MGDLMFFTKKEEIYIKYIVKGERNAFTDRFVASFYDKYKVEGNLDEAVDIEEKIRAINNWIDDFVNDVEDALIRRVNIAILGLTNFPNGINLVKFILLYSQKEEITNYEYIRLFADEISLILNNQIIADEVKYIMGASYPDYITARHRSPNIQPTINSAEVNYYKLIYKELKDFIERGTPENYKLIIEDKGFKGNKKKYLSTKDIKQKEWVLFARTFELNKDQLLEVIKLEENIASLKTGNSYFNKQKINLDIRSASPFEKVLLKVRNEYLHIIDPVKFTKYE